MIQQSLNDFDIDLENSWLIGDKKSHIETAINANISNKILKLKATYLQQYTKMCRLCYFL